MPTVTVFDKLNGLPIAMTQSPGAIWEESPNFDGVTPLAGSSQNTTVNLTRPGQLYGDRITSVDMRFAKILRFGRTRTNVGFDIYNVLNTSAVLNYNQAFIPGGNWLVPTGVIQPRIQKFSAQIDEAPSHRGSEPGAAARGPPSGGGAPQGGGCARQAVSGGTERPRRARQHHRHRGAGARGERSEGRREDGGDAFRKGLR